jgi:hypothetical protein
MTGAIERIVVALEAASENRTAIDTAARLAARWKTRLHGVFVEDDDLIRLAHLPFARQVTLGFGVQTLNLQQARRQMHAFAERARRDLAAAARRHRVEWSFEIVHGAAAAQGVAATTDLFVAGALTRPIDRHFRVECRWWSVGEPIPAAFLLAHRDWHPHSVVAALLHSSDTSSERLLTVAARLAEANAARLAVFCTPDLADTNGFKAWLDGCLADHAVTAEVDLIPGEPSVLYRRIAELDCWIVAVEASADQAQPERLRELVATVACDVLVVR